MRKHQGNDITTDTADMSKTQTEEQGKRLFSMWKVLLPVVIGLCVVGWMLWRDATKEDLGAVVRGIHFSWRTWVCFGFCFLFMFGRDWGMSWRFRTLTSRQLSWWQAFKVQLLVEFTSCITPSAVGGSSMGMVFLNSQGVEFGRAITLMMTTLFLDELYLVVFCPIIVLLTPGGELFVSGSGAFNQGIRLTFWIVYSVIALWTLTLFCGIIWKPSWMRGFLKKVTSWRLLRRWQDKAVELGDNMVATSKELRNKPFGFWAKVFGGTSLSWFSRYLVVNALFFGFLKSADAEQWIIFAREFVLWVVLMVSPTPGGSGLSEWLFSNYYGDIIHSAGLALVLAIIWRLFSYYLYLIIGVIIVPGWIKSTYQRLKKK